MPRNPDIEAKMSGIFYHKGTSGIYKIPHESGPASNFDTTLVLGGNSNNYVCLAWPPEGHSQEVE